MGNNKQYGYALLALLLVLFVTGSSLLLGSLNNRQQLANTQQSETLYQLLKAKQALLAFSANSAAIYANTRGPGYFPCPDTDGTNADHFPDLTCNSDQPLIGRLPDFANVPITTSPPDTSRYNIVEEQLDQNRRFWYVVAPRHVRHSSAAMRESRHRTSALAPESNLRMSLDGTGNFVALIIAPGEALSNQNRITSPNNFGSFSESQVAGNPFSFVSSLPGGIEAYNDQIIGITHEEYMEHLGAALAGIIKGRLATYHTMNGVYPEGTFNAFGDNIVHEDLLTELGSDWIASEQWNSNSPTPPNFCTGLPGFLLPFFPVCLPTPGYRKLTRMFFTDESVNSFRLQLYRCNMSYTVTTPIGYEFGDNSGC